jgi:hypothetical protein
MLSIKKNHRKVNKHSKSWTKHEHYGFCGQNCPCCRFELEYMTDTNNIIGVCTICISAYKRNKRKASILN